MKRVPRKASVDLAVTVLVRMCAGQDGTAFVSYDKPFRVVETVRGLSFKTSRRSANVRIGSILAASRCFPLSQHQTSNRVSVLVPANYAQYYRANFPLARCGRPGH